MVKHGGCRSVLAGQDWRSYPRSRATPRSYEGMAKGNQIVSTHFFQDDIYSCSLLDVIFPTYKHLINKVFCKNVEHQLFIVADRM
ncbi:MAG: hypothetical protein ACRDC6_03380, partial [Shewanella sp.]